MLEGYLLQEIRLRLEIKERATVTVRQSKDVVSYLTPVFEGEHREMFIVVPLNARHQALGYRVCHVGSVNSCQVHMAEVFRPGLITGAAAIICARKLSSLQEGF